MEEKRNRLLKIYHEHKEVFNLKEMEKLGAKAGVGPYCFSQFTMHWLIRFILVR